MASIIDLILLTDSLDFVALMATMTTLGLLIRKRPGLRRHLDRRHSLRIPPKIMLSRTLMDSIRQRIHGLTIAPWTIPAGPPTLTKSEDHENSHVLYQYQRLSESVLWNLIRMRGIPTVDVPQKRKVELIELLEAYDRMTYGNHCNDEKAEEYDDKELSPTGLAIAALTAKAVNKTGAHDKKTRAWLRKGSSESECTAMSGVLPPLEADEDDGDLFRALTRIRNTLFAQEKLASARVEQLQTARAGDACVCRPFIFPRGSGKLRQECVLLLRGLANAEERLDTSTAVNCP